MVKPSKIIFLIQNSIPQKEDIMLLYILGTIVSPNKILLKFIVNAQSPRQELSRRADAPS